MLPFLKWAGGKRWLLTERFLASLPKFDRYIEPFLGGGAAFFAIKPEQSVLSDVNPELINSYEAIRDNPDEIERRLESLQEAHSSELYYKIRASSPCSSIDRAVRTIYLNRTCWNGLYRLNRKGEFNVPIGSKTSISLPTDNFKEQSRLLLGATISCLDFEDSINRAGAGDLLFVDPPYTVKHNMNGFVKYNESIFKWEDQERLRNALLRASARGSRFILTNADHESVRELYCGVGKQQAVERRSVISGKSHGRSSVTELVITA